jgi:hypothetical protein
MFLRSLAATCFVVVLLGAAKPLAPSPFTSVAYQYAHHEIVVRATIDGGGPYAFLLDTGTTPSSVDEAVAKKLGIRQAPGSLGTLHGLRFGTMVIGPLDVRVTDLAKKSKTLGVQLAGVLGSNFVDGRSVRIDYPCDEVAIVSSHEDAPYTAKFTTMPSGSIDIDDAWASDRRIRATIDTGNAGAPIVKQRGTGKIDLRIGDVKFGSVEVRFSPPSKDAFDVDIGNRTLERYVVTLDYLRGRLTIAPGHKC